MNNKLFKDLNLSNTPSRNGFDLSHNIKFSAKAGELLPVTHFNLMIGDSIKIGVQHRTRTASMSATPFTEIREYFDFFFVPYRLLWKMAPNILAQDTQNPVIASSLTSNRQVGTQLPQISMVEITRSFADQLEADIEPGILHKLSKASIGGFSNEWGFNRVYGAVKLLNMLGYCYITNKQADEFYVGDATNFDAYLYRPMVSLMPILAYNKIYYDFFRNTAWEKNQPYNYNVDYLDSLATVTFDDVPYPSSYWQSATMFDLRYSNYPKDVFFGLLPDSQFGEEAEMEGELVVDGNRYQYIQAGTIGNAYVQNGSVTDSDGFDLSPDTHLPLNVDLTQLSGQLKTQIGILEMRKQKFLQRYREIVGSGSVDYQNIVKKVFGVDVPDNLADHSIYLGGISSTVGINNHTNSNLSDGSPVIRSTGDIVSKGDMFEFTTQEFGIIMCIYHAQPVIDYSLNAYHFDVLRTEVDDFANPVFDRLGFQGLPYYVFNNYFEAESMTGWNPADDEGKYPDNPYLGYTSRYYDYKTSVDRVFGVFRELEEFKAWLSPVDTEYLQDFMSIVDRNDGTKGLDFKLNSSFFKVDPRILDSIFYVPVTERIETDQLYVSAHIECNKVTNLDYLGMPIN